MLHFYLLNEPFTCSFILWFNSKQQWSITISLIHSIRTSICRTLPFGSLWKWRLLLTQPGCWGHFFICPFGNRSRFGVLWQHSIQCSLWVKSMFYSCLGQDWLWHRFAQHSPHIVEAGIQLGLKNTKKKYNFKNIDDQKNNRQF